MADNFGLGVSRTLDAIQRQFQAVIWQQGKPPLDSELNLMSQLQSEALRQLIRSQVPSGFFTNPVRSREDFVTNPLRSNSFELGNVSADEEAPIMWANVNGWVIPVTGTANSATTSCVIKLFPPPTSNTRIDFVFLEVWKAQVAPNPSTVNKPSASTLFKYGNVEFGGTNLTDDLQDPAVGFETTERLQVQYRLRVVGQGQGLGSGVSLDVFPDGLDDPNIVGQGAASSPVAGFVFENMRQELGDPSLWRAGDGDPSNSLGTVDGFTYAIPVCAVFRRNSSTFTAINAGNPNHNGALDRNPSASFLSNPRDGAITFSTASLVNALSSTAVGVTPVIIANTPLADSRFFIAGNRIIQIDNELIEISAVNLTASPNTMTIVSRGRGGSDASGHSAGSGITAFQPRYDGLFADQVASQDILDLRKSVTFGNWDYQQLLTHSMTSLLLNQLGTSFKITNGTQGVVVPEVSLLQSGAVTFNQTEAVDGPDGIRVIFSDSASLQPDVTMMLDDAAAQTAGFVNAFDNTAAATWDVGASFRPTGFMTSTLGFQDNSVIFLNIGGEDGTSGARGTFRDGSVRAVRFVSPVEYWKSQTDLSSDGNQYPVSLRFISLNAMEPAAVGESAVDHPKSYHPLKEQNFERPFIFLGGVLHPDLVVSGIQTGSVAPPVTADIANLTATTCEVDLGLDFDAVGVFFTKDGLGDFQTDPTLVSKPLLRGQRTLFDMLTNFGQDSTGNSSQVYLVLYGDETEPLNNGAFRVIGAGATAGYTENSASTATRVVLTPLNGAANTFITGTNKSLTAEIRSQFTNSEDGVGGALAGPSSACIVLTDLSGITGGPWASVTPSITQPIASKAVVNMTLQYHPGRGASPRVPDNTYFASIVNGVGDYLRKPVSSLDSTFAGLTGFPTGQIHYDVEQIQLWNRLPSLGLPAPDAPNYGGRLVGSTEIDREAEAFFDNGSKTLLFRPFQKKTMTLRRMLTTVDLLGSSTYLNGKLRDGAAIFTANRQLGFPVPQEYMPRFGRQDIPFFKDTTLGSASFLNGVNHLFADSLDATSEAFFIIGGEDNAGPAPNNLVKPMLLQTGTTSFVYGEHGEITGPTQPAYQARLFKSAAIASSDMGAVFEGIQLPPNMGIARLYAVYDRAEFVAKIGTGSPAGGFTGDRVTPKVNGPANLLRQDATKQTLYILQGGGQDVTGNADDHTYIVPATLLDLTRASTFNASTKSRFDQFDFVVECCVFGFARGFINKNNYVLARRHSGTGALVVDNIGNEANLPDTKMILPCAAAGNDTAYLMYDRTVYQGDPFMTRAGSTRSTGDYDYRYGQVANSDAFLLNTPIQQTDSNGNLIPQRPNARSLEVLASLDFYTTLGTGKIGGDLYAGTVLDVGFLEPDASARKPSEATQPDWRVLTRGFSEGQKTNKSHASLLVDIKTTTGLLGTVVKITTPSSVTSFTAIAGVPAPGSTDFQVGATTEDSAANLAAAIQSSVASLAVRASSRATSTVLIEAVDSGTLGNLIRVSSSKSSTIQMIVPLSAESTTGAVVTSANLSGGVDLLVNAGDGSSQLAITGMTERLPLGILAQDSDFMSENILSDNASAFKTFPAALNPIQNLRPQTTNGEEFDRFLADAGSLLGMSDGSILVYQAFDETVTPSGAQSFRLYRGGGSVFMLSGKNPGGPIDWLGSSFPASIKPILKGGVLAGKALLVRNYEEEAFSTNNKVSSGDELQMVVLTSAIFGDGQSQVNGLTLNGTISPTGYGEGYSAADRYLIQGRPLIKARTRVTPDPATVPLALFNEG